MDWKGEAEGWASESTPVEQGHDFATSTGTLDREEMSELSDISTEVAATTRSPTDNTMMAGGTGKQTTSSSFSERMKNTFGNIFPFTMGGGAGNERESQEGFSRCTPFEWGKALQTKRTPGECGKERLTQPRQRIRTPPSYQTPRGPADSSGKTKAINGSRTSTILMFGGFLAAGPGKPAYWVQLLVRTGDLERNPGPETYLCPICGKEIKDRRQISVWCHLGGYVHMKCTSLRSIKGYSDEFVCDRCSWCKGEGGKREIRERRRIEKRKRREKVQKTRAEKREREAKTKGKGKATRVWTWNIQGARVSFPRRNRFAEILRCINKSNAEVVLLSELREKEEGMKWIKAKDMFGVLIHGKRSRIILRDEWALDWRDQGCKRTCGDRSSAVEVNQIKFVATYQPLWNSDRRDFDAYREEPTRND